MKVQLELWRGSWARDWRMWTRAGSSVEVSGWRRGVNWRRGYMTVLDDGEDEGVLAVFDGRIMGDRNDVAFLRN